MIDADPSNMGLAFRFVAQLRDRSLRAFLATHGYVAGQMATVVSKETVVDQEVLRRQGLQVIQEDPDSEFGWKVLPAQD